MRGGRHHGGRRGHAPVVDIHVAGPQPSSTSSHTSPSIESATQPLCPSPTQPSTPLITGTDQPRTSTTDNTGEILTYMKHLEKKIDAIDRRVSEYIKKEKNTVRPNVTEQDSVSEVSTQKETCMDVTSAKSQPLISVGVEFDTLLQNWERSGRERDMFVKNWSEIQPCLNIAREILESVTNVDKTDDLPPEHGSV